VTQAADGTAAPFAEIGGLPATTRRLKAGDILFRQGDPSAALHLLHRGRLRLQRHTPEGTLVILHTARAGESFAEAALFAPRHHCDAVALADSLVVSVPKPALLAALRDEPERALRLAAMLAAQLRTLRGRLETRNIRSARERLLHHVAASGGAVAAPRGGLSDLAAELGLTREALYRTIARLVAEGALLRGADALALTPRAGSGGRQQQG
jgi:CRP-like cAMP-binding protein